MFPLTSEYAKRFRTGSEKHFRIASEFGVCDLNRIARRNDIAKTGTSIFLLKAPLAGETLQ